MSDSQTDDAPDGLTKEQLWKRVRRLEKHAFPDRRDILKAGGALGAAGVLGGAGYGAGKAEAGTQSDGDVGTAANPSDAYLEDVYPPGGSGSGNSTYIESLSAAQTEITNETLVDVYLGADLSLSANTITTVPLDTENKDERGEFDATNNQFSPDQGGWYWVSGQAFFSGIADQDGLQVLLEDTTASTFLINKQFAGSGTRATGVGVNRLVKLTAGNLYELQVRNFDSSCTIINGQEKTFLTIRRAWR